MSNQTENLKYVGDKWGYYNGCSCSAKNFKSVSIPPNSKAIWIKRFATLVGPVTKIAYQVTPHQIALDIDAQDAEVWLNDGTAIDGTVGRAAGKAGRLTRNVT